MELKMDGKHSKVGSEQVVNLRKEITKMVKIAIVFVVAVALLIISFIIKTAHRNENLEIANYKQTYATIERTVFSDTGNAMYYVSFMESGNKIVAQTDYYSSDARSLNPGDEVKIGYFFTKRGTPSAVILDERVVAVANSVPGFYKFLTVTGILLLLVSVAMFAKAMFL